MFTNSKNLPKFFKSVHEFQKLLANSINEHEFKKIFANEKMPVNSKNIHEIKKSS